VIATGRTGWYLRVLEPGELGEGDAVELVARPHADWPVARASRVMHELDTEPGAAAGLLALPELSGSWRATLAARRP
jgi:MOSC domain-containing protein YiiM